MVSISIVPIAGKKKTQVSSAISSRSYCDVIAPVPEI